VASRGQYLGGRAVDAIWDKELTLLMQHHRASVAEEALADLLMQDLDNP
jgi:hypothetical protein